VRRPGHGVTIGDVFLRGTPQAMRALLDAEGAGVIDLAESMRTVARRRASRL
jgi:hypothetical protein